MVLNYACTRSVCVLSVFVWMGKNDLKRYVWTQFFFKMEKNAAFSNENGCVWTGTTYTKTGFYLEVP